MKKPIIILIVFIVFCNNIVKAQGQFAKRSATINGFLSAVFKDKKDTHFIMDNYMHIASNDTISITKKEVIITHMIDTLVIKNSEILSSTDYKVYNYDSFKGNKKKFNTDNYRDIMILSVKNKAIIYFYFNQERINSFFVIDKGSLSFFLTI